MVDATDDCAVAVDAAVPLLACLESSTVSDRSRKDSGRIIVPDTKRLRCRSANERGFPVVTVVVVSAVGCWVGVVMATPEDGVALVSFDDDRLREGD